MIVQAPYVIESAGVNIVQKLPSTYHQVRIASIGFFAMLGSLADPIARAVRAAIPLYI